MHRLLGIAFAALVLFAASTASAQAATDTSKYAWDQTAPNLAAAQAYVYKAYNDNAAAGVTFTSVTCTGTVSPFRCTTPITAFTPGAHTTTVTASNAAGESLKSNVLSFQFVVIPAAPANLSLQ